MSTKHNKSYLNKLEDLFSESDYVIRYEKGNFKSGYCLLKDTKIAIINKYFPVDGKINALLEILGTVEIKAESLSEKNKKLLLEISQTRLDL